MTSYIYHKINTHWHLSIKGWIQHPNMADKTIYIGISQLIEMLLIDALP